MSIPRSIVVVSVTALLGCGMVGCSSGRVQADDDHDKVEDAGKTEATIAVDQLPQAVVDTVMKECPGGKITEAEKETKGDKSVYEMDVKVGSDAYEVKTTLDGQFRSKKVDDDDDEHEDKK
jgi:uncharacterized membrane protein YkoI